MITPLPCGSRKRSGGARGGAAGFIVAVFLLGLAAGCGPKTGGGGNNTSPPQTSGTNTAPPVAPPGPGDAKTGGPPPPTGYGAPVIAPSPAAR